MLKKSFVCTVTLKTGGWTGLHVEAIFLSSRFAMKHAKKKRCKYCSRWFLPDYRTSDHQIFCSNETCQKKRRALAVMSWRIRHPGYEDNRKLKNHAWARCYPFYWRKYRLKHPEYSEQEKKRSRLHRIWQKNDAKVNAIKNFTVDAFFDAFNFLRDFSAKLNHIHRRAESTFHVIFPNRPSQKKTI